MGVKSVDEIMRRDLLSMSLVLFIFGTLLLICSASAQCIDCDDHNPCTKDFCNGSRCEHTPKECYESSTAPAAPAAPEEPASSAPEENPSTGEDKAQVEGAVGAETTGEGTSGEGTTGEGATGAGTAGEQTTGTETGGNASESEANGGSQSGEPSNENATDENPVGSGSGAGGAEPSQAASNGASDEDAGCDDANPCTTDRLVEGVCVHDPVNCDDGNSSTLDICGPNGCINAMIPLEAASFGAALEFVEDENASENETDNADENADENATEGNESQTLSRSGMLSHPPLNCDDGNPCTEDIKNGSTCEHRLMDCDDANASTYDYCYEGECYHTTMNCSDTDPCTTDSFDGSACVHIPKNCDDHNACTTDSCENGNCVRTPRNCDDGNPCTSDRCDSRTGCQHPSACDDRNPCTYDYCDSRWGCLHPPVVCYDGKTCIDGICMYPYWMYLPVVTTAIPITAPIAAAPQSYTIPAGTSVTLPWGQTFTAIDALHVDNGLAYPGTPARSVIRSSFGYERAATLGGGAGLLQTEQAEVIGLSWRDAGFDLLVIRPDGTALPEKTDGTEIVHLVSNTYDYYFLREAPSGSWSFLITPINPSSSGSGYSLLSGRVQGVIPTGSAPSTV